MYACVYHDAYSTIMMTSKTAVRGYGIHIWYAVLLLYRGVAGMRYALQQCKLPTVGLL